MAKTPPSRSYRLFSGVVCLACAYALSAKAAGAAVSASPATTLRLVMEVKTAFFIGHSLIDGEHAIRMTGSPLAAVCCTTSHWPGRRLKLDARAAETFPLRSCFRT